MLELNFQQRPVDVPVDLRLYRRLAILIIAIGKCCPGQSASLRQLHFYNALFIDPDFYDSYLKFKKNDFFMGVLSPSADPYLNRCIGYAIGLNLIKQKIIQNGFRLVITQEGKQFLKNLEEYKLTKDIFMQAEFVGKIPETEIKRAIRMKE
jgi:hypothetical protein